VAEHIVTSLSEPYTIEDVALEVSASIGIAAYPESARTIHGLLDAADEAMYRAKKAGGRRSVVAQPAA
jgi:diguanylate cyclase (GGDEF)-like protein